VPNRQPHQHNGLFIQCPIYINVETPAAVKFLNSILFKENGSIVDPYYDFRGHFIAREEAVKVILENTAQQTLQNLLLWSLVIKYFGETVLRPSPAAPGDNCPLLSLVTSLVPRSLWARLATLESRSTFSTVSCHGRPNRRYPMPPRNQTEKQSLIHAHSRSR